MRYPLTLVLCFVVTQAAADSWPPAKVAGLASPTGQIVVRVVPGASVNVVDRSTTAQNGQSATATFYRLNSTANYEIVREFSLLNPIAPVVAVVADSGELVTLDNWYGTGMETPWQWCIPQAARFFVAIVSPTYTLRRRSRSLIELYPPSYGDAHLNPCLSHALASLDSWMHLAKT